MPDPDYKQAMQITGKSETELLKWTQTKQADFIVNRSDDAVHVVYTDGDDGLMIFTGACETFGYFWIKIETISKYCYIADEDLTTLLNLIRENSGE